MVLDLNLEDKTDLTVFIRQLTYFFIRELENYNHKHLMIC